MAVLSDDRLHEFIGGRPATLDELRQRHRDLVAGSHEPTEVWLNWIVRRKHDQVAVGTMQATISTTAWQSQGFGSEAARSLVDWLRSQGVDDITANIHPDHHASAIVASRVGLQPTNEQHSGETVWRHAERR